jgi:ABC-2 type transport system ATP-binding protein
VIPALQIENLYKCYKGADFPALSHLSLTINKGEVFGLLGPNGAGKTTLISIITGLVKADSGKVEISGEPAGNADKRIIGLVPQEIALYPTLTARENLSFIGAMYGIKREVLQQKVNRWLEVLGLSAHAHRLVGTYSGGMKRRINLIAALLHDPEIIILDEPTVGVDIQSKVVILEQLSALNRQGKTIVYTSHQMEEAEQICTSVGIISKGKIICQGRPQEILANNKVSKLEDLLLELTGKDSVTP